MFRYETRTDLMIARNPMEFICGVSIPTSGSEQQREAKFSGKHAPHLMFILDEADAIPDEVFRGIESCMSRRQHAAALHVQPENALRGRLPHDSGRQGPCGQAHRPSIIRTWLTGEDVIPGAVDRPTTIRRINEWARPLAANEKPGADTFELPGFLEGAVVQSRAGLEFAPLKPGHYKIMDPAFSYMVLGEYPAQGANQLIAKEWIDAARLRWNAYVEENGERPPVLARPLAGLDVAEFGADANVLIFRSDGFVTRPVSWSGMDLAQTAHNAAEIAKEYKACRVMVDSIGVGAAMPGMVTACGVPAVGVKTSEKATVKTEAGEFHRLRDQLWWTVREWLRTDPGAMLPPDESLIEDPV